MLVNARDAQWFHNELGAYCGFEGCGPEAFPQLGVNLNVLPPGKPMAMYHAEAGEEAFLVLRGECLLIVEGEERPLRAWDFFYFPPCTEHVIVGAGTEPALVLAVGARGEEGIVYPRNETALKHDAGSKVDTSSPAEAYAGLTPPTEGPPPSL